VGHGFFVSLTFSSCAAWRGIIQGRDAGRLGEWRWDVQRIMTQRSKLAAFEEGFSTLADGRHCVAVQPGSAGVHLALRALGIGSGDEVVVPSYGPEATAAAVRQTGATPVFADIDPQTFCLDAEAVAAALTPRTSAVVAVHLFGHPAAMERLSELSTRHGIALVEDASQALTASLGGRRVGTHGVVSTFQAGGAAVVTTADLRLALTMKLLRGQGHETEALTDEAAATGSRALAELTGVTARRRANARFLNSALTGVLVPHVEPGAHHVYHQYTVRVPGNGRPDRDAFALALTARGVRNTVGVPTPLHRLPAYRSRVHLPQTELAVGQALALPVHSGLTQRELVRVAAVSNTLGGLL
jgi:dTDP-4-amino-4,6-dideoxygalactose transaminase